MPLDFLTFGAVSFAIETSRIKKKTKFYIAQLGLPLQEDSEKFRAMKPEFRERMKKLYPVEDDRSFFKRLVERTSLCFPITGLYFLKAIKDNLNDMLDEMEKLALHLLDETAKEHMKPIRESKDKI